MNTICYTDPDIIAIAKTAVNRTIVEVIDPETVVIENLVDVQDVDTIEHLQDMNIFKSICRNLVVILDSIVSPEPDIRRLLLDSNRGYGENLLYLSEGTEENLDLQQKLGEVIISNYEGKYETAFEDNLSLYWLKLNTTKDSLETLLNTPGYLEHIAKKKPTVAVSHQIMSKIDDFFAQNEVICGNQLFGNQLNEVSLEEREKIEKEIFIKRKTLDTIWNDSVKQIKQYKNNLLP